METLKVEIRAEKGGRQHGHKHQNSCRLLNILAGIIQTYPKLVPDKISINKRMMPF